MFLHNRFYFAAVVSHYHSVTINSGMYSGKILNKKPNIEVNEIACPLFVPLIEEGFAQSDIIDFTLNLLNLIIMIMI